jgi:sugar lactone lactonase YvrE
MAFQDDTLAVGPPGMFNIGVNGLKIRGHYLYFTNTNRKILGRIKIDDYGNKDGDMEIIYQFPSDAAVALDDFALDKAGNAYQAAWPGTLCKITPEGKVTIVLNQTLVNPTSASFGEDDATLYVVTSGQSTEPVKGGQLIKVEL